MTLSLSFSDDQPQQVVSVASNQGLWSRLLLGLIVLVVLTAGLGFAGKWAGRKIALAGHSDDRTAREIVIGNNVFVVPANMIRAERARVNGVAARLDVYLHWPDMDGYSPATRDDFNNASGAPRILFLSIEPRIMSRDMSGRFEPIYRALIQPNSKPGPAGINFYEFSEKSGYVNEVLAVAERSGAEPFVARCLSGQAAASSLAPCQRDIDIGRDLSLSYRFPAEYLGDWQNLDNAVSRWAANHLRTAF